MEHLAEGLDCLSWLSDVQGYTKTTAVQTMHQVWKVLREISYKVAPKTRIIVSNFRVSFSFLKIKEPSDEQNELKQKETGRQTRAIFFSFWKEGRKRWTSK